MIRKLTETQAPLAAAPQWGGRRRRPPHWVNVSDYFISQIFMDIPYIFLIYTHMYIYVVGARCDQKTPTLRTPHVGVFGSRAPGCADPKTPTGGGGGMLGFSGLTSHLPHIYMYIHIIYIYIYIFIYFFFIYLCID